MLTQTALVHNAAWKQTFDTFLETWSAQHGQEFVPFDPGADYHQYVDGRPRADGVRTFLASRQITLPEGTPDDGPDQQTVNGIGNIAQLPFMAWLDRNGGNAKSVKFLELTFPQMLPALQRGTVDAIVCPEPFITGAVLPPVMVGTNLTTAGP